MSGGSGSDARSDRVQRCGAAREEDGGGTHPSALSLDPPSSDKPAGQVITNEAGHKAVTFSVPTSAEGKSISFGLILVGTIEHQM